MAWKIAKPLKKGYCFIMIKDRLLSFNLHWKSCTKPVAAPNYLLMPGNQDLDALVSSLLWPD